MNINIPILAILFCLPAATAGAAEIEINPGLWETTMTRTNPMTGQPITETSIECVKDKTFDPAGMMQGAEECNLVEDKLDGDILTYRMQCNMQGGQSIIDGQFQTDGQTGKGNMHISINAGGMQMKMNMNWTGKRVGDC